MSGKSPHDPADYELAFEIWAFRSDGDIAETVRRLRERDVDIPDRTIRYWVSHDCWPERKAQRLAELLPALHRENLTHLILGSGEGFAALRQVARGEAAGSVGAVRN